MNRLIVRSTATSSTLGVSAARRCVLRAGLFALVATMTASCAGNRYPPPVKAAMCAAQALPADTVRNAVAQTSWQVAPQGPGIMLDQSGYPCSAFKHDAPVRPSIEDEGWTSASPKPTLGFSKKSKVPKTGYRQVLYRYYRTQLYVGDKFRLKSLTLSAKGIDDSLHWVVFNSKHPKGISPDNAGPSAEGVGTCQGNGSARWDLSKVIARGEVNTVMLVHAEMQPPTTGLGDVRITANGRPIDFVTCD